jgi:hypothetical protein
MPFRKTKIRCNKNNLAVDFIMAIQFKNNLETCLNKRLSSLMGPTLR